MTAMAAVVPGSFVAALLQQAARAGTPTALQFRLLSKPKPWAHSLHVLSLPQVLHTLVFGHCR